MARLLEDSLSLSGATTRFPHQDIFVKNTFIQVKDSEDADQTFARIKHKPSHKRCVSEPLWITQASLTLPEGDDDMVRMGTISSCTEDMDRDERAAFEISTTASSPPLTHRDEGTVDMDYSSPGNEGSRCGRRGHLRQWSQLSTQTADSFDMEVAYLDVIEGQHTAVAPSHRSEAAPESDGSHMHLWSPLSVQPSDGLEAARSYPSMPKEHELTYNSTNAADARDFIQTPPPKARTSDSWSMPAAVGSASNLDPLNGYPFPMGLSPAYTSPVVAHGATASSAPPPSTCMFDRSALLSTHPNWCDVSANPALAAWHTVSLEADTDAAETLSSYARGVAAGAAQTAFARGFAAGAAAASAGAPKQLGSLRENQANSSPCGERISLDDALCPHAEAMGSTQCQMFWCDPRAFKETAFERAT